MSKFDRIFADKLNEEQAFPGQDQNWNKLTGMLGAHDLMLYGISKRLRMWKAIAAVSITAVVGLAILTDHLKDQNKALQAALQQQQTTFQAIQTQMAQLQAAIISNKKENLSTQNSLPKTSEQQLDQHRFFNINQAIATFEKTSTPNNKVTEPSAASMAENHKNNAPSIIEGTGKEHELASALPPSEFNKENADAPQEVLLDLQKMVDSLDMAKKIERIAQQDDKRMPVCAFLPSGLRAPSVQAPELPALADATARNPMVRTLHRHDRVRVGVQTLIGSPTPKEKGVSLIMGNGITAEVSPIRNFWITASADWTHFDVSADTVIKRFRFPDPPHAPSHQMGQQLVHIDASPRQQQFALGLRYRLPIRSWVRPSVRIAHVWTHVAPGIITYRFEKKHTGPGPNPHPHEPEYLAERTDVQFYYNTWKAGIGLEHETKRWVFGLYGDYAQKNIYQTLFVQAGIQYRFN